MNRPLPLPNLQVVDASQEVKPEAKALPSVAVSVRQDLEAF